MKKTTRKLSIALCFILGITLVNPAIKTNALTKNNTMSEVVIHEDNEKTIIALVDNSQKEAYLNDILTNSDFKEGELNKTNLNSKLPAGQIMAQKFMYKRDIQKTVDRYAGYGTYARILSNPITDATVGALIKAAKFSNPWAFAATALTWSVGDLMNRQQSWWNESLLQILKNKIKCVRVTHIRNTVSNYPAAYLIIERISR